MVILAGHTRFLAAQRLGMEKVPVHVARGLSLQQARAYRIMDNRSRDASEWDLVLLPLELSELKADGVGSETAGFSDDELAAMLAPAAQEIPEGNREIDEDAFADTKSSAPNAGSSGENGPYGGLHVRRMRRIVSRLPDGGVSGTPRRGMGSRGLPRSGRISLASPSTRRHRGTVGRSACAWRIAPGNWTCWTDLLPAKVSAPRASAGSRTPQHALPGVREAPRRA
jgi:hypothetical protein